MTDFDRRRAFATGVVDQHDQGVRIEASHACPECPLGHPSPFCPTCLGAGLITTGQLARWQLRTDGGLT